MECNESTFNKDDIRQNAFFRKNKGLSCTLESHLAMHLLCQILPLLGAKGGKQCNTAFSLQAEHLLHQTR